MPTEAPAPASTPGHPPGCTCGECEIRSHHDPKHPDHQQCNEHGRCLTCDGCIPCGMENDRNREIGALVAEYPGKVQLAERAVYEVRKVADELIRLYDIETAEGSEGADALHELDEIQRRLRHVRRLADARLALEKTWQAAYANAQETGQ